MKWPDKGASSRASGTEAELSVDARAPGVIKLFGESVVRGAQYKAVLASTRSTAQELVKQALERYGLPSDSYRQYVLCDTVGVIATHSSGSEDEQNENTYGFLDEDDSHDPGYERLPKIVNEDSGSRTKGVGASGSGTGTSGGLSGAKSNGGWTVVSSRVLDDTDRPLELHMYWKPPEGFSRRFELHRRDDVVRDAGSDDTCGLNDNARKIMMAKVPPGVIPPPPLPPPLSPDRHKDGDYSRVEPEGRQAQPHVHFANSKDSVFKKSSPDTEVKYAYVGPSIYPYLLTLRGYDIQKDLVLYPLKSKTLTVGRNHRRSHVDDIGLLADDVMDLHCRIHLKTLPTEATSPASNDRRRYWYCLHVEVIDHAVVFLNGVRVEHSATVHPGDLLGVGQHYLFLYKDPTGGHDIPETLPWYLGASSLYAKVNKAGSGNRDRSHVLPPDSTEQEVLNAMANELNDYYDLDDLTENSSTGEMLVFLAYPRDKESEVLDHIANISCSSSDDFPLSTTVLMMACQGYAARRFPPSHQAGFFRRLLRAIRNRVSVVSKALSVQKYQSGLYKPTASGQDDVSKDGDPLLELLCWLSNVVRIYNHVTTPDFRARIAAPQPPADVMDALQELTDSLEEMISFMFQQTVYSITKVLFTPVSQIVSPHTNPAAEVDGSRALTGIDRVLHVLRVTLNVGEDVSLHSDVIIQLLTYLIFFVTTTLFNKLMAKGAGSKHFCWSVGVRLQTCVSQLEEWVSSVGLEAQYLRVAERLLSLVDLLATSRHTLLRMDWPSFRRQYSPLSESQLLKVLTEYQFSEGQTAPASWLPPPGVHPSEDVTISLSAHPPFILPRQGPGVDLRETYPPPLYKHLEQVQRLFSLDGEGSHSEPSSSGGTPRQADPTLSISRGPGLQGTFFTSDSPTASYRDNHHNHTNNSHNHHRPAAPPPPPPTSTTTDNTTHRHNGNDVADHHHHHPPRPQRHKDVDDDSVPPKLPPRSSTIHFADPPVQPFPERRTNGKHVSIVDPLEQERRSANDNSSYPNSSKGYASVLSHSRNGQIDRHHDHRGKTDGGVGTSNQEFEGQDRVKQSSRNPHYSPSKDLKSSNYINTGPLSSGSHHQDPSSNDCQSSNTKREPPPYHKVSAIPKDRHFTDEKRSQPQDNPVHDLRFPEPKAPDPRRRPLNGLILNPHGPLTLQDKRMINNVPPLEIPHDKSSASESASDDVFVHSSAELPPFSRGAHSSDFRRFSTGMLSQEKSDEQEEKPEVVKVNPDGNGVSVNRYPDDIYIDVKEMEPSGSARQLRVLPLEDGAGSVTNGYDSDPTSEPIQVRYRHKMPQERDSSTKGEITGEVFTLTLIKEGSRLGMGLIDGMVAASFSFYLLAA
nr:hypothetical protein BaRGS_024645 [Batillaria attramentaria]